MPRQRDLSTARGEAAVARRPFQSTSAGQSAAVADGTVPPLEQVRSDVWAVALPMPSGQHIGFSLAYLLRDADGGIHVIDTGWDTDENWRVLADAVRAVGGQPEQIASVTVTHMHPDHLGMVNRLRAASGATVTLHAADAAAIAAGEPARWTEPALSRHLDEWGVPEGRRAEIYRLRDAQPAPMFVAADTTVGDGDVLEVPGFSLRVMSTPGHTAGSICLRDDARAILFTGDHILPTMHAGLGLGGPTATNPLADYLRSLRAVAAFDDHEALPGHGYRFTGLAARARRHERHHARRAAEVAAVLAADPNASPWKIAAQLTWTAGWSNMTGFFLFSALTQTAMFREFVLGGGSTD
ncbi:hypothetical protein GCM10022240_16570 [Microbacterium kribbense]|uniref:Metallo-beta-lactamase domain-containing protein n=1 Tax=Microbacterium kribbense TaxID=433645 RepID=A0ABP7GIA1_9MICO